jgi:hypothetical protein
VTITLRFSRNKRLRGEQRATFQRIHFALYRYADGNVVQVGPERDSVEEVQTDVRHWKEGHLDEGE